MISIIVPAHNEASVIAHTLQVMLDGAEPGELEIIVVCNGCTDETAAVARKFGPPVQVIETERGNKIHALNLGDKAAHSFPRIYADADVLLTLAGIRALARQLNSGSVLAASPTPHFDLRNCSSAVQAFYAIAARLPSSREGIGGSGVYALSEAGRARFDEFPAVTADDGFVRIQFAPHERTTLSDVYSTVFAPRNLWDLVSIKTRSHLGSYELAHRFPALWKNRGEPNDRALIGLFADIRLWPKLLVYCFVKLEARRRAKQRLAANPIERNWARDETSRRRDAQVDSAMERRG